MNKLTQAVKQFWNDEQGVTAVEYALIVAAIAGVIVIATQLIGTNINTVFGRIAASIR